MRSKNGTYLIEAAVVFPVVILTVITVVLIIMYFYQCSAQQCEIHKYLRNEAGESSGKRISYSFDSDSDFYTEYSRNSISASKDISMIHRGVLYRRGRRALNGTIHLKDPARYVLRRQLINDW